MDKRSHIDVGAVPAIAAGTEVNVYTDAACTVLATLYADDGVTPADNPVIVDANGEFFYRAANGVYYEKIGAQPAAELRFDDGSGYATPASVAEKLPITANIYETQVTNFTIQTGMAGKTVPVSAVATATLPAWNDPGFGNGFQCVLFNTAATAVDITLSGTVVAVGTKINQKKAAVLSISGGTWRATGGLTT